MSTRLLPSWVVASLIWAMSATLAGPAASLDVPYLAQRVTDLADLLDPSSEASLEERLRAIEAETGSQVAVLTVPGLEGEVIEDYALRVAEAWKLGREGVDDGVLLLVARDDRKVRIEVGYGLEGAVTDLQSRRMIDELIGPAFRRGDFAGGIGQAVEAIGGAIRGEADVLPPPTARGASDNSSIFLLLFLSPMAWAGLATPGRDGWTFWAYLTPFIFFAGLAAFGSNAGWVLLALWLVVGGFLRLIWPKSLRMDRSRRRRGGLWVGGPFIRSGGSGRRGGFSSGGGFSGGGGSFGGGGASGSW